MSVPLIPLLQHPDFVAALRAIGVPVCHLPGIGFAMTRRLGLGIRIAMLSRLGTDGTGLAKRLKQSDLAKTLLIIGPDAPAPRLADMGAVPLMTPAWTTELDLSPDTDQLRRAMHQKWRNRLRHGETQALRISRQNLPPDPSHWLLVNEARQRVRRRYRSYPLTLTTEFARRYPAQTKLFTAWEGRDPVAAMLVLIHGGMASYHIGHTTARGRSCSAHNLLLWDIITYLAQTGIRRLDLGLIDPETNPGLARFKLGSGARARCLGGTWAWWPPAGRCLAPLARLDRQCLRGALNSAGPVC